MSIEQTPHGTWRVRWRDHGGAGRSRTFKRKVDATRFEREVRTDLQRGTYVDVRAGRHTVATWADQWLAGAMNLGAGGRETYRRDLDRYVLPALGHLALRHLTTERIETFLADELDDGLAPSTVHRHYRTVRRLAQVAVERRLLAVNPCDAVTPPKLVAAEMRFLDAAQVDALAAAIAPRYRAWVLVAAWGGLRWSELVGLRRARVDDARVTVAEQLVRRADGQWHRVAPKTATSRRTVVLPAFVADELAAHLDTWSLPGPDGLVFPNQRGAPMVGPSFRGNVWVHALAKAGIGGRVRVHDLRHTAVALMVAAGVHPKAIQARMGHASISVTLDRYGHLFPQIDAEVADALDRLRGGS